MIKFVRMNVFRQITKAEMLGLMYSQCTEIIPTYICHILSKLTATPVFSAMIQMRMTALR